MIHKMVADDEPMDIYLASLLNSVCNLNDLKISTAFSGIDNAGTVLLEFGGAALLIIGEAEKTPGDFNKIAYGPLPVPR